MLKTTVVGLVQVCAMVSLLTGKYVPPTTAMTGEVRRRIVTSSLCSRSDMGVALLQITLRGRVSPVGGIKRKVLGAHRAGANRVILPFQWANRKDFELDVAKEVQAHTVRVCEEGGRGARCCFWTWLVAVAHSWHPLVELFK